MLIEDGVEMLIGDKRDKSCIQIFFSRLLSRWWKMFGTKLSIVLGEIVPCTAGQTFFYENHSPPRY